MEIYTLANDNHCNWQHVFRLWEKYSAECSSGDQSAILWEFKRFYKKELTCGGRTIWNSDGLNGPVLLCAPPSFEDVQRMVGVIARPFDGTLEAVEAELRDKEERDERRDEEQREHHRRARQLEDEQAERAEDEQEREWNEVDHQRDMSVGDGETDAERNA